MYSEAEKEGCVMSRRLSQYIKQTLARKGFAF